MNELDWAALFQKMWLSNTLHSLGNKYPFLEKYLYNRDICFHIAYGDSVIEINMEVLKISKLLQAKIKIIYLVNTISSSPF